MKILHIIPSAFSYFEVIRKNSFILVDGLNDMGFENYIFTLQYSAVNKRMEKEVKEQTKNKMNFEKIYSENEFEEKMDWADIIHLHAPFLGMGKKILNYKEKNPQKKLVITVNKNLQYVDFFTIIIWLYNKWYLNKLIQKADFVCATDETVMEKTVGNRIKKDDKKFVPLNDLFDFINKNNPLLSTELKNIKIKGEQLQNAVAYGELYRILNGE